MSDKNDKSIFAVVILLAAMLLTGWWQKRAWYFQYIAAPASVMIACTGAFWAVQRILFFRAG